MYKEILDLPKVGAQSDIESDAECPQVGIGRCDTLSALHEKQSQKRPKQKTDFHSIWQIEELKYQAKKLNVVMD